jgi:hypothetical protein
MMQLPNKKSSFMFFATGTKIVCNASTINIYQTASYYHHQYIFVYLQRSPSFTVSYSHHNNDAIQVSVSEVQGERLAPIAVMDSRSKAGAYSCDGFKVKDWCL